MSILNMRGTTATAGIPCLYHLTSGQLFYSETVREDGDSFIFDTEQSVIVIIDGGDSKRQVSVNMLKMSETGFKGKQARVMKTAVIMISDCGEAGMAAKAHEAMSGLVLPGSIN